MAAGKCFLGGFVAAAIVQFRTKPEVLGLGFGVLLAARPPDSRRLSAASSSSCSPGFVGMMVLDVALR